MEGYWRELPPRPEPVDGVQRFADIIDNMRNAIYHLRRSADDHSSEIMLLKRHNTEQSQQHLKSLNHQNCNGNGCSEISRLHSEVATLTEERKALKEKVEQLQGRVNDLETIASINKKKLDTLRGEIHKMRRPGYLPPPTCPDPQNPHNHQPLCRRAMPNSATGSPVSSGEIPNGKHVGPHLPHQVAPLRFFSPQHPPPNAIRPIATSPQVMRGEVQNNAIRPIATSPQVQNNATGPIATSPQVMRNELQNIERLLMPTHPNGNPTAMKVELEQVKNTGPPRPDQATSPSHHNPPHGPSDLATTDSGSGTSVLARHYQPPTQKEPIDDRKKLMAESRFEVRTVNPIHIVAGQTLIIRDFDLVMKKCDFLQAETGVYTTPVKGEYKFRVDINEEGEGLGQAKWFLCQSGNKRREKLNNWEESCKPRFCYITKYWKLESDQRIWLECAAGKKNFRVWVEFYGRLES